MHDWTVSGRRVLARRPQSRLSELRAAPSGEALRLSAGSRRATTAAGGTDGAAGGGSLHCTTKRARDRVGSRMCRYYSMN